MATLSEIMCKYCNERNDLDELSFENVDKVFDLYLSANLLYKGIKYKLSDGTQDYVKDEHYDIEINIKELGITFNGYLAKRMFSYNLVMQVKVMIEQLEELILLEFKNDSSNLYFDESIENISNKYNITKDEILTANICFGVFENNVKKSFELVGDIKGNELRVDNTHSEIIVIGNNYIRNHFQLMRILFTNPFYNNDMKDLIKFFSLIPEETIDLINIQVGV